MNKSEVLAQLREASGTLSDAEESIDCIDKNWSVVSTMPVTVLLTLLSEHFGDSVREGKMDTIVNIAAWMAAMSDVMTIVKVKPNPEKQRIMRQIENAVNAIGKPEGTA